LAVNTTTDRTQPILVGGLVMGVLSALPFISAANLCCCLWVIAGGMTAAYLLQQNQAGPITAADGAMIGLLAGLAGALINFIVAIPIDFLMAPFERAMFNAARDMSGTLPPGVRDMLEQASRQREAGGFAFVVVQRVFWLFVMLVIGAVFSTVGGVLGAALFRKPAAPAVIDVPPSPPSGMPPSDLPPSA
jgi:hypothetical protein